MYGDYKPRMINAESKPILTPACDNAMKRLKSGECGIDVVDPLAIYTIATVFLEEVARELGEAARNNNGEAKVKIHDFMTLGVTRRDSDDAEKDGNLSVVMTAGPNFKLMIKNDGVTEEAE